MKTIQCEEFLFHRNSKPLTSAALTDFSAFSRWTNAAAETCSWWRRSFALILAREIFTGNDSSKKCKGASKDRYSMTVTSASVTIRDETFSTEIQNNFGKNFKERKTDSRRRLIFGQTLIKPTTRQRYWFHCHAITEELSPPCHKTRDFWAWDPTLYCTSPQPLSEGKISCFTWKQPRYVSQFQLFFQEWKWKSYWTAFMFLFCDQKTALIAVLFRPKELEIG